MKRLLPLLFLGIVALAACKSADPALSAGGKWNKGPEVSVGAGHYEFFRPPGSKPDPVASAPSPAPAPEPSIGDRVVAILKVVAVIALVAGAVLLALWLLNGGWFVLKRAWAKIRAKVAPKS